MNKAIFIFNNNNIIIEFNNQEEISSIIGAFIAKTKLDYRKLDFIYNNIKINEIIELTIEEILLEKDKINNKMIIIVNEKDKNEIKKIIEYDNKVNHIFKKNPNLKYKLTITDTNDSLGCSDIFEVFISYKDNKEYLASPNFQNHNLDIFTLIDNKKIKSLKGHQNQITTVKYFINNKFYNEYLISGDKSSEIIVWDINKNYSIKKRIPTNKNMIYNNLLIFQNDKYKGELLVPFSFYILYWYNKRNNNYYTIHLNKNYIKIQNYFQNDENYKLINYPEDCHLSGFIYTKDNNDYLCCSSSNGYINIWDLYNKKIFKTIDTDGSYLLHIIQWNSKYIIVADYTNYSFKVIDIESGKIVCDIGGQHKKKVICIKKIYHPIYGESLLSASEDHTIKLWTI